MTTLNELKHIWDNSTLGRMRGIYIIEIGCLDDLFESSHGLEASDIFCLIFHNSLVAIYRVDENSSLPSTHPGIWHIPYVVRIIAT